jgi:hypothetical protein
MYAHYKVLCTRCGKEIEASWNPQFNDRPQEIRRHGPCDSCRSATRVGSASSSSSRRSTSSGGGDSSAGCAPILGLVLLAGLAWYVYDGASRWLLADFRATRATPVYEEPNASSKSEKREVKPGAWLVCVSGPTNGCETTDTPSGRWVKVKLPFSRDAAWLPYEVLKFDLPWYKDAVSWAFDFESTENVNKAVREAQSALLAKRIGEALGSGDLAVADSLIQEAADNDVRLEGAARCRLLDNRVRALDTSDFARLDAVVAEAQQAQCTQQVSVAALEKERQIQRAIIAELSSVRTASSDAMRSACRVAARDGCVDPKALMKASASLLTRAVAGCKQDGSETQSVARLYLSDECAALRTVMDASAPHKALSATTLKRCRQP